MERIRRRSFALAPLLLVTLFGLPLVTPLLRWTAVACTHDGHLHYHRIAAMRHAWEQGVYFTRWLPDLAFGYGYPFFVYREPAPLYGGLFLHLAGLPLPAASNLLYIFGILAAGWFMYLWARDVMGSRAGVVAAVAYMSAPYVLIDALVRGNLPESLALALFPFLLWAGRRWLLSGTAGIFLAGVFGLALLALSHNISLLLFTPALFLYLLTIGWLHRLSWRVAALRLALLFGLGLGMTIFYAGGALLEMDQVTLEQSTTTRNNDFRFNFTSLDEILAPVLPEDPALVNPPLPFRLGWAPAALALIGLSTLFWSRKSANTVAINVKREQQWHIGVMAVATAVFLLMSLPLSQPLWEALPLIDFVQFPWRFVGRAALPVAFLAGAPFASGRVGEWASGRVGEWASGMEQAINSQLPITHHASRIMPHVSRFTLFAALTLLLLEAFPNLYPSICREEPFPTINSVHGYERETGLVGVDPEGSYFPRTVRERPGQSPLEANYQAGQPPQRFDAAALPEGAVIHAASSDPLAATLYLSSPEPFLAYYQAFDFPGWTAWVDGEPVAITPSNPEGLITFAVPAGEHVLAVRWQSTPLRTFLLGLSLLSLVGVVIAAVVLKRGELQGASYRLQVTSNRLPLATCTLLLVTGLILLAFKLLVVDRVETPLRRAVPPLIANSSVLQAGELRLMGYNLSQSIVTAGDTVDVNLAWTAMAIPAADYQSNVWLAGPDGLVWSEKNTERPRLYEDAPRTGFWQAGQWGWDSREVEVLPGTPPGQYDIVLTLFDLATLQPLTLIDTNSGATVGPTAVIGHITVEMPAQPVPFNAQFPRHETVPGTGLRLLGFNQDRAEVIPGEQILLTLFWERQASTIVEEFSLHLFDEGGQPVHAWESLPVKRSDFPTQAWPVGSRLRGQYLLRLPATLESGLYYFRLQGESPLGEITVRAPERLFTPPDIETAIDATFSDSDGNPATTLIGYTQSPTERQTIPYRQTFTLVWQSQTEFNTSYRVFIHLIDKTGRIIGQSDSEPAGWTRPTTSWVPGEYILDNHQLSLPENLPDGPLSLRVGLYNPDTGERLQTGAADFVTLPLRWSQSKS